MPHISSWDDYPVHQAAEYIAHPATSDANFYDRYYFNMHSCSDEIFVIFGLGCYPNLNVVDAFVAVATPERHRVVRASKPLADRMDLSVGPIRIEVIKPLEKLRVVCEPTEHNLEMDVEWNSFMPAIEEQNQYIRHMGKVAFDTQRFTQMGFWSGSVSAGGESWKVKPKNWQGVRDRSWGVRPVGEAAPDPYRAGTNAMGGMWNHFPMQFEDHILLYMCQEQNDGSRTLEEGRRIWKDPSKPIDHLGRPEFEHQFHSGTRVLKHTKVTFAHAPSGPLEIDCTPLIPNFISIGTGYGLDEDWRHGLYHGPELVVQGKDLAVADIKALAQYGVVDQVGKFEYEGNVGYGLYEHGFFGPFERVGFKDAAATAP